MMSMEANMSNVLLLAAATTMQQVSMLTMFAYITVVLVATIALLVRRPWSKGLWAVVLGLAYPLSYAAFTAMISAAGDVTIRTWLLMHLCAFGVWLLFACWSFVLANSILVRIAAAVTVIIPIVAAAQFWSGGIYALFEDRMSCVSSEFLSEDLSYEVLGAVGLPFASKSEFYLLIRRPGDKRIICVETGSLDGIRFRDVSGNLSDVDPYKYAQQRASGWVPGDPLTTAYRIENRRPRAVRSHSIYYSFGGQNVPAGLQVQKSYDISSDVSVLVMQSGHVYWVTGRGRYGLLGKGPGVRIYRAAG